MLSPEKIEERLGYLGGSDAAAVVGLSRWASPLSVWAEKTRQLPPREVDSEAAELGSELEDYVAKRFSRKSGKEVRRVNETIFHPEYPFLAANIDRRVVGEKAILECKTASAWKSREWDGEDIPVEYIIQTMHYLAVTGSERAYLAVLIGNQDFKWKTIERDSRAISELIEREVYFWREFVEKKVMPVAGRRDKDTLSALFPVAEEGKSIALGDEAKNIIELLDGMKQDAKNIDGNIEEHENRLRVLLGDAESGYTDTHKVYWTNLNVKRFNAENFKKDNPDLYEKYRESSKSRRFLIKENKKEKSNG